MNKQELNEIREYAKHYTQPITDLKGFNNLLKEHGHKKVSEETLIRLLNY